MSKNEIKCAFGLRNDKIVHIEKIKELDLHGLSCECFCPVCGEPLESKIGTRNRPHFSHTSNGCSTQTANETALHRFAKQTIQEAAYIKLPDLIIKEDLPEIQQMKDEYHYHDCLFPDGIKIVAGKEVQLQSIELEKSAESFIPDITAYVNGQKIFIEIAVSHFIDIYKFEKIKELNIPTIEIDLSHIDITTLGVDELRHEILDNLNNRTWSHYAWMNIANNKAISLCKKQLQSECPKMTKYIHSYRKEKDKLRNDVEFESILNERHFIYESPGCKFPFYLDIPITDEIYIKCDRRTWQMIIFDQWVYNRRTFLLNFNNISKWLKEHNTQININWNCSDEDNKTKVRCFYHAIKTYLKYLSFLGFISPIYEINRDDYHRFEGQIWNAHSLDILDYTIFQQRAKLLYNIIKKIDINHTNPDAFISRKLSEEYGCSLEDLVESITIDDRGLEYFIAQQNEEFYDF